MPRQDPEGTPHIPPSERAAQAFRVRATAVLEHLRASMVEVLTALGDDLRQPRDLKAALNIHQTLAWKLFRFATGTKVLADARQLPGAAGIKAFLTAARARDVPEALLDKVSSNFDRYRALIDAQAGDRTALELMLAGLDAKHPSDAISTKSSRRNAFKSNSAVWGTQMRLKLMCQIIAPTATGTRPDLLDFVLIRGFMGIRRLRQGARLAVLPLTIMDSARIPPGKRSITTLDPESKDVGLALMPDFCSKPFPPLLVAKDPAGIPEWQLGDTPLGDREGASIITGQLFRAAGSRYRTPESPHGNTALSIRMPIETAVLDAWTHIDLLHDLKPKALLYSGSSGISPEDQRPEHVDHLPIAEKVERLGQGLSAASLIHFPRYRELITLAFERGGWNPQDFVLHRMRQDFPAMPTSLVMRFELPPPPQDNNA